MKDASTFEFNPPMDAASRAVFIRFRARMMGGLLLALSAAALMLR